jgi:hypothetical protein
VQPFLDVRVAVLDGTSEPDINMAADQSDALLGRKQRCVFAPSISASRHFRPGFRYGQAG